MIPFTLDFSEVVARAVAAGACHFRVPWLSLSSFHEVLHYAILDTFFLSRSLMRNPFRRLLKTSRKVVLLLFSG